MTPRKQHVSDNRAYTHVLTEIVIAYIIPAQVQTTHDLRTEKGKWTQKPAPN